MHVFVGKLTIIGSDNGEIILIGPLGTKFRKILIEIQTFSFEENPFENDVCKMLSRPRRVKQLLNWG